MLKKPKRVLLGSTTECFQPIEKEFCVSRKILEILNKNKIYFSILTRAPIIADNLGLLSKGFCENVYFTINNYDIKLKNILEPKAPAFSARKKAIDMLKKSGINVIPYFFPREKKKETVIWQTFFILILTGIIFSIIILIFRTPIANLINNEKILT